MKIEFKGLVTGIKSEPSRWSLHERQDIIIYGIAEGGEFKIPVDSKFYNEIRKDFIPGKSVVLTFTVQNDCSQSEPSVPPQKE